MHVNQLVCLGLSHQTAPVALRERLSIWPAGTIDRTLLSEVVVLTTCNRMELYGWLADGVTDPVSRLIDLLARVHKLEPAEFVPHLYWHQGEAVVTHLCRVASGLESLVLGETQILGQITGAQQCAQAGKLVGPVLSSLFRTAIRTGKRTHTETAISNNPASISSVALTLAQQVIGDLSQRRVLVVGLGEMGHLALKGLRDRGVTQLMVTSRTLAKASVVAEHWQAQLYPAEAMGAALAAADVVISATSTPGFVINQAMIAAATQARGDRPLVLIDLAVPRDIEPTVAQLPNIHLFDVDHLRRGLDEALHARQREIPQVEAIITNELEKWRTEFGELRVRPVVVELRQKAEAIRQRELERTLRHLGEVDPAVLAHMQHLSHALVNQLLHEPTLRLKDHAHQPQAGYYASMVSDLFGLAVAAEHPY